MKLYERVKKMKNVLKKATICILGSVIIIFATNLKSFAFTQIPFEFEYIHNTDLDWYDREDDSSTGSVALGFMVNMGGDNF